MALPELIRPSVMDGFGDIMAGFSTRRGGVSPAPYESLNLGLSTADDRARVCANRERALAALGFRPERMAIPFQVHGGTVSIVTEPGAYPGRDGLATRTEDVVLSITAADCAAVLLADPVRRVIAACHAGWRGTVAGIVSNTVAAMASLGADPACVHAYVSPCISRAHFEVGEEVAARFDPAFVVRWPGKRKPYVDLKAAIRAQLQSAGVPDDQTECSTACTYAETQHFFSHRAEEGKTGRMMGFIALQGT